MAESGAYRKTTLFSNMETKSRFNSIQQNRLPLPMIKSLKNRLSPNYMSQTMESWNIALH